MTVWLAKLIDMKKWIKCRMEVEFYQQIELTDAEYDKLLQQLGDGDSLPELSDGYDLLMDRIDTNDWCSCHESIKYIELLDE